MTLLYFLCAHTVVLVAVGVGVFGDTDRDFAGFFSLGGDPASGCLSYGFGISFAALFVNVIATVVGSIAIFFNTMKSIHKRGKQN